MWGRLMAWFRHRPNGAAVEQAQRQADDALAQDQARAYDAARAAWDARAVRWETDLVAEEIRRTMRPRETG